MDGGGNWEGAHTSPCILCHPSFCVRAGANLLFTLALTRLKTLGTECLHGLSTIPKSWRLASGPS